MTNQIQKLKSQISNKSTTQIALLQLLILIHIAEEYGFGFPVWATRFFGTTSYTWYIVSHVFVAFLYILILFATYKGKRWGLFLSTILQSLIATNGLFHITTTIIWREYSPGVISQIVLLPSTFIVYSIVIRNKLLTLREVYAASVGGIALCILVCASLFLDIRI